MIKEWYVGKNNYQHNRYINDSLTNEYHCSLNDTSIQTTNIVDAFHYHLEELQGTCDLLYSGGLDSEFILRFLMSEKIPTNVITMKVTKYGCPLNITDLYYSEKFCRENNLKHYIVELDITKFFDTLDYINFLKPYHIDHFHVASHFWLINQCHNFPIFGGDYRWPWNNLPIISPIKYAYNCYDLFMKNEGIIGIGNMISYSLDSMLIMIKQHKKLFDDAKYNQNMIHIFKKDLYESFGLGKFELRPKSYGWESIQKRFLDADKHNELLRKVLGTSEVKNTIYWGDMIADIIGENSIYCNDQF